MVHFHIVTLFPESIEPYLNASIIGRAIKAKKIKVTFYDPKKFTRDKYGRVDRRPYGGGPGMVLEPDAILRAADAASKKASRNYRGLPSVPKPRAPLGNGKKLEILFFSTDGELFDEAMAEKLAKLPKKGSQTSVKHIILICGHYEGIDARVQKILKAKKVSVGPYVLTGGELPAATVIDAISRFVPGVLGKAESLERSRVSSPEVYTRPDVLTWKGKKYKVPEVLKSGHHAKIEEWKKSTRTG